LDNSWGKEVVCLKVESTSCLARQGHPEKEAEEGREGKGALRIRMMGLMPGFPGTELKKKEATKHHQKNMGNQDIRSKGWAPCKTISREEQTWQTEGPATSKGGTSVVG